ncbi:hypothetical protein VDGL01_10763 [Verticillium dahliae]
MTTGVSLRRRCHLGAKLQQLPAAAIPCPYPLHRTYLYCTALNSESTCLFRNIVTFRRTCNEPLLPERTQLVALDLVASTISVESRSLSLLLFSCDSNSQSTGKRQIYRGDLPSSGPHLTSNM